MRLWVRNVRYVNKGAGEGATIASISFASDLEHVTHLHVCGRSLYFLETEGGPFDTHVARVLEHGLYFRMCQYPPFTCFFRRVVVGWSWSQFRGFDGFGGRSRSWLGSRPFGETIPEVVQQECTSR